MSFVIAGVVLTVSFAVGVVSLAVMPMFEKVDNAESEGGGRIARAIAPSALFSRKYLKQTVFIFCLSLICALAAGLSFYSGTALLSVLRQSAAAAVLLSAMIIDRKTHIIPNVLILISLGFSALMSVAEFIFSRDTFLTSLIMSLAGLVGCAVLFYILSRLTKEGIGMGDVKLISVIGCLIGFSSSLMCALFALVLCAITSIVLMVVKKKNKNDSVPFGPFLFYGYILMFLLFSI